MQNIIYMAHKDYKLHLKGYVGGWNFDADYIDYVLNKYKDEEVNVLIDSLGGDVATALSVASAFNRHGNVNVHYVGMNASAATIASLGAKCITIDENAMYLVHKCSQLVLKFCSMNAEQLADFIKKCEQKKEDLDKIDLNVASMYAKKCKKDKKALLDLMAKGGWLTAHEAKEWGFVDEVTDFDKSDSALMTKALADDMKVAGILIPDIPFKKENSFADVITGFFDSFRTVKTEKKDYKFDKICNQLGVQSLSCDNGVAVMTVEQLQQIEMALEMSAKTINDLEDQIKSLKIEPAEDSNKVINNDAHKTSNPFQDFSETYNKALKIFNEL